MPAAAEFTVTPPFEKGGPGGIFDVPHEISELRSHDTTLLKSAAATSVKSRCCVSSANTRVSSHGIAL